MGGGPPVLGWPSILGAPPVWGLVSSALIFSFGRFGFGFAGSESGFEESGCAFEEAGFRLFDGSLPLICRLDEGEKDVV